MVRYRPRCGLLTATIFIVALMVLALQLEGWEMIRSLVVEGDGNGVGLDDHRDAEKSLPGLVLEERNRLSSVASESNTGNSRDLVVAEHSSTTHDIARSHDVGARQFLESIDDPERICTPSQRCPLTTTSINDVAIYPSSVGAYRHPFGSCRRSSDDDTGRRRVPLAYSQNVIGDASDLSSTNFTRFWPLLPDLRTSLNTSEHERCHFVMARMLAIVASVLNHYNMTNWFITHATLLGAVREGGFIPWDADIDIAMPRSHLTFLRKRWRREFPRDMFLQSEKTDTAFHMWNGKERAIRIKDRYSNFPGMRFSVQKGSRRYKQKKYHLGAHVDVIPLEKRSGKYKLLHSYFDAKDVYPLGSVCFENMQLPAPRNVSNFLRILYGDDFLVPPKNATFGGPTVLPCLATQRMRGNPWSLSWVTDHREGTPPRRWPRNDPDHGTFLTDFKTPHRLYYNSKW